MIEKIFNFVTSSIDSKKDFIIGILLGMIATIGILIMLPE